MATVDAMQQANKDLKRTYKNVSVDRIERIQDEMEDLLEQSGALQETLSRSYAMPEDIDEEELEAELEALEEEPLEQESDMPSYLQHATDAFPAQPDSVDELPAESEPVPSEMRAA